MRARALILSASVAAACTHQAALKEPARDPPTLSVPRMFIASVCEKARLEQGDGHWDGHAHLLWSKDGSSVTAIECSFTARMDGLTTVAVRVYLSDPSAQALRDFLQNQGH